MSPQMRAALGLPPSGLAPAPPARAASSPDELARAQLPALAITLRVQRRLAIRTMSVLIGSLLLVPPALVAAPSLERLRVAGVPVLWLLLGVGVYPALLLLASRHRRAADRLETELDRRDTQISG